MNPRILLVFGFALTALAACAPANEPGLSTQPLEMPQNPTEPVDSTDISPSDTPQPEPTEPVIAVEADPTVPTATTLPTDIPIPAPTLIPCQGNLTSANQEGPYYSPGSPERTSLIEEGMDGTPVLIRGGVFDQNCNPIAGAKVDFWLADVNGEYDLAGYRLRGHVFTDGNGYYEIESIEPGIYTGRPPHIHVKVFSPDGRELLTTQMYFPGSEGSQDVSAAPDLLATYIEPDENGRKQVIFNFVVSY